MKKYYLLLVINVSFFATNLLAQGHHYIGEKYCNGIVFYIDSNSNGQHGLIAATKDQSTSIRWSGGSSITRALADGFAAGLKNTAIIIGNQGSYDDFEFAASICNEYSVDCGFTLYGDWYLPSKCELNLLFLKKDIVGGFAPARYWSSLEFNKSYAWAIDFYSKTGDQVYVPKYYKYCVRAIKMF